MFVGTFGRAMLCSLLFFFFWNSVLHYVTSSIVLVKYLYEVKQHQRKHVVYGGHVLGKSVHDPAWKKFGKALAWHSIRLIRCGSTGRQKQNS